MAAAVTTYVYVCVFSSGGVDLLFLLFFTNLSLEAHS